MIGITPKFAYNPGTGVVDLVPTNPPVNKTPFGPLVAVRHDSITSSGIKQSVTERIDKFLVLDFVDVPYSDMAAWNDFMSWALAGNQIDYYPDSMDPATWFPYTLEDMTWQPKKASWLNYSFTLKFRAFVGTSAYYS